MQSLKHKFQIQRENMILCQHWDASIPTHGALQTPAANCELAMDIPRSIPLLNAVRLSQKSQSIKAP